MKIIYRCRPFWRSMINITLAILRKRHQSSKKMKCHSFYVLSFTFVLLLHSWHIDWSDEVWVQPIFVRLCRIAVQICQTKLLVNYHGCQNCNISNLLVRESYETSYKQHLPFFTLFEGRICHHFFRVNWIVSFNVMG